MGYRFGPELTQNYMNFICAVFCVFFRIIILKYNHNTLTILGALLILQMTKTSTSVRHSSKCLKHGVIE